MKNSAWYHKLWRKKLDKLPLKSNADTAWANMQQLLDAHLPPNQTNGHTPSASKPLIAKIITLTGYVLPAAAMISVATWFAVKPVPKQKPIVKENRKHEHRLHADSANGRMFKNDSSETTDTQSNLLEGQDSSVTGGKFRHDSVSIAERNTIDINNKPVKKETPTNTETTGSATQHTNTSFGSSNSSFKNNKRQSPDKKALNNNRSSSSAPTNTLTNNNLRHINSKYTGKEFDIHYNTRVAQKQTEDLNTKKVITKTQEDLVSYPNNTIDLYNRQTGKPSSSGYTDKTSTAEKLSNAFELAVFNKPLGNAPNATISKPAYNKPAKTKAATNKSSKEFNTPLYNYGLEAGISVANKATGFYGGVAANYALTSRWLLSAGVRLNSTRKLEGSYSHPSFYRPDSSAAFTINESRKIQVFDVPLTLEYKLSNSLSLKAGAVISFVSKPADVTYKLGPVAGFRDTLRRSKNIDSTVNSTVLDKNVRLGFTGGVSFHIKQLGIEARYLALPPYKLSNKTGSYSQAYNPFQVGVSYWFRNRKKSTGK